MGTSLNGLTPATTYTGLLKFGDNTEITSSLKAISDGAGNDTILELSTTALQIGGSTGAFWDDTNKRLGIGTNAPNSLLNVIGSGSVSGIRVNTFGADSWMPYSDGNWYIRSNGTIINDNSNAGVSIGVNSPTTARLLVKGSGTTSATTSLLVQNSDGTQLFKINDNRDVFLGSSTNYIHQGSFFQGDYYGVGNWNFGTTSNLGARLGIKGSGTTTATTALLVQNSAGAELLKVEDGLEVKVRSTFRVQDAGGNNAMIMWGDGYSGTRTLWVNGSVGVGVLGNNASAKLQVDSTTQGFLPPRMTTTQKNAISTPASGLQVYDTDLNQMSYYNGTTWVNI